MTSADGVAGGAGKVVAGIGGWLLLPLLGLCLTPFVGAWNLWQVLPTLGVLGQVPIYQAGFLVVETIIDVVIQIAAPIYLLVQMLPKRSAFPRLYQYWLGINLIWMVLDIAIAYVVFREVFATGAAEIFDRDTARSLTQGVIGAAIWIPYMARSVRVRNTFVN